MNLILFLISLGLAVVGSNAEDSSSNDYVFDLPDLVETTSTKTGSEFQLEAFGSKQNAAILNCGNESCSEKQKLRLFWVSIGQPEIIAVSEFNDPPKLFHFLPEGFHFYIQMLTQVQRQLLAETATAKYGISIDARQIAHLVLEHFDCKLSLNEDGKNIILHGQVNNFHSHPLRMDFNAPKGSLERETFQSRLNGSRHAVQFKFQCELASVGKIIKGNRLSISSEEIASLHLQEQLLGLATSAYVTRDQLNTLASLLHSTLNIIEEYQVPEDQFQTIFINDLISQAVAKQFTHVPALDALKDLSSFAINFDSDLRPDEILKNMGSVLEVSNESNRSHIIVNEDKFNTLKDQSGTEVNADVSYKLLALSLSKVNEKALDWQSSGKTLNDQLRELNKATSKDIHWDIQGLKVIPKTLNVAKLTQSSLKKSWTFNRIKKIIVETPFKRSTALYVSEVQMNLEKCDENNTSADNDEAQCFIKKDCSGENNFLIQFSTWTKVECLEFCQSLDECAWFTFHPNENWCKAYKDCPSKGNQSNCTNCISGQRTCDDKCSVIGNCRGNMILKATTKTDLECLGKCQKTEGCQWHSYDRRFSTCQLFTSCKILNLACKTCRTSSIHCAQGYSKVLVALDYENISDVEIIDLLSSETTCQKPQNFPYGDGGASGGFGFHDKPLICGSVSSNNNAACHLYEGGAWRISDSLKQGRGTFAMTKSPFQDGSSKLFLTGGVGDDGYDLSSSEVLTENGWQESVPLPVTINGHCMVTVNSTAVMVIGGNQEGQKSGRSFLFNSETNIWTEAPTLNIARAYHGCGSIRKNSQAEDKSLISVGGSDGPTNLRSVEVLDLDSNAWRSGPDLPFAIHAAAMVEDPSGGVVLIGGLYELYDDFRSLDTLYRLRHGGSDTTWELMSQKLKTKRFGHTTLLIPDDIANCH